MAEPDAEARAVSVPPALLAYLRTVRDDPSLEIVRHEKLAGGAIQQNIALDLTLREGVHREALVLRTDAPSGVEVSLSRAQEHAILAAAFDAGVTVPEPLHLCTDTSVSGRPFFLMRRVDGTANPVRLTRNNALDAAGRDALVRALGAELARVHAVPLDDPRLAFLSAPAADGEAERKGGTDGADDRGAAPDGGVLGERVALYRRLLDELGARRPVLEWTLAWLARQRLAPHASCLCHNDFRTGNLMIEIATEAAGDTERAVARVAGVLDWEFAAPGDPHEDIGWFCAPCWRFAARGREAGGLGEREAFYAGYEAASGRAVDRDAVTVWEIVATVRWAVIALQQGARFTSGAEPTLELGLTGRMIAGLERDLLELVPRAAGDERAAPAPEDTVPPARDGATDAPPSPGSVTDGATDITAHITTDDAPDGAALLEAARASLLDELLPSLPDARRYPALMVANAMGIAARELRAAVRSESGGGAARELARDALCDALRGDGVDDLFAPSLLVRLHDDVTRRLALADPKRPSAT